LTLEQMAWRRWMIEHAYRGSEEDFAQEYPAYPEEAFVVTGTLVFDKRRLKLAYENTKPPKVKCEVKAYLRDPYNINYEIVKNRDGRLWIWEEPKSRHVYRIGVDVSEGVGRDYSAIEVFDCLEREQVAEWQGYADPITLAYICVAIARFYNEAKIAIELNGPGLGTHTEARRFYWNFYHHKYMDRFTNKETDKINWLTTPTFKRMLISYTQHVIDEGIFKFNSERLIAEFMVYMKEYTRFGELGSAPPGFNDDLVMASMIAMFTAYQDGDIYTFESLNREKLTYSPFDARVYYPYDQDLVSSLDKVDRGDEHWLNL